MEPTEIKSLIEEQGRLFVQFKEKHERELAELKAGHLASDVKVAIDAMQKRFDEIEVKMNRPKLTAGATDAPVAPVSRAFVKFLKYGLKDGRAWNRMDAEEKTAWEAHISHKDLSVSPDASGGFLSTEDFRTDVIRKLPNYAGLGAMVSRITTANDVVRYPKVNYTTDDIHTSGLALTWEDEADSTTTSDPSPFGSVSIQVKKVRVTVKVSRELLEDSAVNASELLASLAAEAFAVEEDNVISVGAGGKKPEGFMTNTSIGTTNSGTSGAFTADGLIDLIHAVPAQYVGGATLMMPRASLAAIRKLKDGNGRYIWEPSYQAGVPATIQGVPVKTNEHIAVIAAAARAAIVADFKRLYMAVDKNAMSVQRLDELYAGSDQVGFIFRRRLGGAVVQPWAGRIQILS